MRVSASILMALSACIICGDAFFFPGLAPLRDWFPFMSSISASSPTVTSSVTSPTGAAPILGNGSETTTSPKATTSCREAKTTSTSQNYATNSSSNKDRTTKSAETKPPATTSCTTEKITTTPQRESPTTTSCASQQMTTSIKTFTTYPAHTRKTDTKRATSTATKRFSSTRIGCLSSTISVTVTVTPTPTTITYQIDHLTATIFDGLGGPTDFDGPGTSGFSPTVVNPQFVPTTIYPGTVSVTAADTTTVTVLVTPTFILGGVTTITVDTPSGFVPIRSSLPGVTAEPGSFGIDPIQKRDHAAAQSPCTTTITETVTSLAKQVTATTVTTLSGVGVLFLQQNTLLDSAGYSSFLATYPGPITVTATAPLTITDFLNTATTTVMLPTQTVTSSTTVYAACTTNNIGVAYRDRSDGSDYFLTLNDTKLATVSTLKLTWTDSAYDCCVAALDWFYVAYWQWSPQEQGACYVTASETGCRDGQDAVVVAAAPAGSTNATRVPVLTGNAQCGMVADISVYLD